jgi:hypothetical protein
MFERADRLGVEQDVVCSHHFLTYYWNDFTPHLLAYDLQEKKVVEVALDRLAMTVSENKRCVGSFDEEGEYHPCPAHHRVNVFAKCQECISPWVPVQACIFEPRCNGDMCDHPDFCNRLHVVYLAF